MTQVLSQCARATYAWVENSVYTLVSYKGIAIACDRNTLAGKKISLTPF